jgi:hypothetical protein
MGVARDLLIREPLKTNDEKRTSRLGAIFSQQERYFPSPRDDP